MQLKAECNEVDGVGVWVNCDWNYRTSVFSLESLNGPSGNGQIVGMFIEQMLRHIINTGHEIIVTGDKSV